MGFPWHAGRRRLFLMTSGVARTIPAAQAGFFSLVLRAQADGRRDSGDGRQAQWRVVQALRESESERAEPG